MNAATDTATSETAGRLLGSRSPAAIRKAANSAVARHAAALSQWEHAKSEAANKRCEAEFHDADEQLVRTRQLDPCGIAYKLSGAEFAHGAPGEDWRDPSVVAGVITNPEESRDRRLIASAYLDLMSLAYETVQNPARTAWDEAMAEFERAFAEYAALDAAEDARRDALYRDVFGENLERFTERVWTQTPGRSRLWFRYPDTDALRAALPHMSAEDRMTLVAAIQELEPGLRAIEADFDPEHQEELSDRWFEALEALDAIPAPDLPALAFKMRQQLALEAGIYPWQIDTEEEMVKQLTIQCGADRLRFTWYQDVLRMAGITGAHVDATAWDPAPWIAEFRAAGGELRLHDFGQGEDHLGKRVHFFVLPKDEAACIPLMAQVRGWKNEALTAFVMDEERKAEAQQRLNGIAKVNAAWDSARASRSAEAGADAHLVAAE